MAEAHDEQDPNQAPMHLEVRETFPVQAYVLAFGLGAIALVAGLVVGLVVVVD